ncbi:unnamed protein product [Cyprideis torosa]|uniref:Uncharacterized protein n=1 Tax=Cyprideis torosa TaxID=163714 RepID=A0A7R8ZR70_9CRUS|nr:unnamed protein product [Cyprideis torosa]CAG0898183.1 unnamed protein product [Cyprideis torosa]
MNSEIEKEPSDFEAPRADVGYALPKFDANEILTDQKKFPESGETPPLTDFVPGSTDNNNQTSGAHARDEIEVSENEGKAQVDPQWRETFACRICGKAFADRSALVTSGFEKFKSLEQRTRRKVKRSNFELRFQLAPHTNHEASRDFSVTKGNTLKGISLYSCLNHGPRSCSASCEGFYFFPRTPERSALPAEFVEDHSHGAHTHKVIRLGDKPLACRICGKAFANRSALGRQKLIQSGEKPFACMIYGKAFA